MREALRRLRWLALPLAAGLIAFLPCLRGGFVWDDPVILYRLMSRFMTVRDILLPHGSVTVLPYYKPVIGIDFWVDLKLFGTNAAAWHADGLFFHLVTIAGVFHLVRRWVGAREGWERAALAGSALFAVWPACVEPLGWISARSELVMGAFLAPALCLHLDARDRGRTALPAAALFFLALCAKETAIAFLGAAVAATVLLPPSPGAAKTGRPAAVASALWLPYVLAYVVYTGARRLVLGPGGGLAAIGASKVAALSPGVFVRAWGYYVREALLLGPGAPFVQQPPGGASSMLIAAAGALAMLAAAAVGARAILRLARAPAREPGAIEELAMCAVWFLAFVSPPLALVGAPVTIALVALRYLYVPCFSIAALAGIAAMRVPAAFRKPAAALLAVAVVACGFASTKRLRPWRSEESLWRRALADDHLSMLANENLASAMQGSGDLAAAEDYGRIACYLSPSIFLAQRESSCYRLLQIYVQERKLPDARRTAVNTARLYPGDEEGTAQLLSAASVIGLLEQAQGDPSGMKVPREVLEKSVPELERAAQIDPLDQVSRMILGQYYRALGEPVRARHCYLELAALAIVDPVLHASAMRSAGEVADEIAAEKDPIKKLYFEAEQAEYDGRTADAISAWQQALALSPDRVDFLVPLADDLNAAGRVPEARDAMLRASQLAPGSAKVWFNLGLYLGGTGDFRGAADAMAKAIALQPGWGQAHLHRGMALDRLGDADGAIAEYKTFLAVYFEERQTRDVVQKRIDQIEARRR